MIAELIKGTKRQWRENWGAKWGGMCPSSPGESGNGLCPFAHLPPQKICWEFYGGFRLIWCDITALKSTQQEADTRVMLHIIYSVHNEGVDHDNDTDNNCHRQLSLISSWTVCTRAFDCQRPWMTLNWPTVALMRSVTLHNVFRVYHKNMNEDWSTLLAAEMKPMDRNF